MKKIYTCIVIALTLLSGKSFSQAVTLNLYGGYLYATATVAVTNYSWTGVSSGTCAPAFSAFGSSSVQVSYPCCAAYTLYCTAYNSSTVIGTYSITTNFPNIALSSVMGNTMCSGVTTTIVPTGANTYTISGGSFIVTPTATTCYTVTGTSSLGCTGTANICLNYGGSTPTIAAGAQTTICAGQIATLTASGASSYTWSPSNATVATTTVQTFNTHCYVVTGATGNCSSTAVQCVVVTPGPAIGASGGGSHCLGSTATLSAYGATSYTWLPGSITGSLNVVTPTASTCYTLIGSNGGCALGYTTVCINVTAPSLTVSAYNNSICAGSGMPAQFLTNGASSYTWYPGGMVTTGNYTTFTPTSSTCYTVFGTVGGCTNSVVQCITVLPSPTITTTGPATAVCAGQTASLIATGASTLTWSYPPYVSGASLSVQTFSTNCYTVYGTAANGCTASAVQCVTVTPGPSMTVSGQSTICAGASVTLTASGVTNYTWLPGGLTTTSIVVTPTAGSCYTVIGDNGSCSLAYSVICNVVYGNPSVTAFGSSVVCAGSNATLQATGASSYTWFPGNISGATATMTPTSTTCFTVVGTSAICTGSAIKCVTVNPAPSLTVTPASTLCAGQSATLTASGASNYTWSPGAITTSVIVISPISSSCYTVKGAIGSCTTSLVRCFTVSPNPTITVAGSNTVCSGNSVVFTASGANTYAWNTGATTSTIAASNNTCYSVVGTSTAGCTATAMKCLTVVATPTVTVSAPTTTVCSNIPYLLTASGASTYTWASGATTSTVWVAPFSNSCYTVIGSNSAGCQANAVACLTVVPSPTVTATGGTTVCQGSSANLFALGATNYVWSTSATTASIIVIPTTGTQYSVTGTNANGCSDTANVFVGVNNSCSIVWAGDANSDGVVDNTDVLELGLAFSSTGAVRSPGGNSYVGQYATNWSGTVSTGKNKCHADCNGDGVVNNSDTLAIYTNYSLTHAFRSEESSSNADLNIIPNASYNTPDTWASARVEVGNSSTSVNQLYGMAFDIAFDNSLIQSDSIYMVYNSSFFNPSGSNVQFRKTAFVNGKIYAASVRTNGGDVSGSGKIADIFYKLKANIPDGQLLNMSVANAKKINALGSGASLSVGNSTVEIRQEYVGLGENKTSLANVDIYPNPARHQLVMLNKQSKDVNFYIYDVLGKLVLAGNFNTAKTIDISGYDNGTYIIQFVSETGISHKKLVIEK